MNIDAHDFIDALKNGNEIAFKKLVITYQDSVINICYGFLQNRHDAEDLAQEVFIEVYRSVSTFKEESSLYTWIYRIAVTKSLDHLRSKKRLKRAAFFEAFRNTGEDAFEFETVEGTAANPEQVLISKEYRKAIKIALDRIPEQQRIAFTLSNFEGLSYAEIADVMQKNFGAIESLIHRAKLSLKRELTKLLPDKNEKTNERK